MLYSSFWDIHMWCKPAPPMKMELAESSETSAYKFQGPRNYREERTRHYRNPFPWRQRDKLCL